MATVASFPITNVQISGNQMTYSSAMDMGSIILWNVNGNHGMGPPAISLKMGENQNSVLPISVGGGQLCELRNSTNMTPVSGRFTTSGTPTQPGPQPGPGPAPQPTVFPSFPAPTLPNIAIGDDMRGCNEIEIDGRTVTIEGSEYGKLFFFCNRKEGGRVVLPKMSMPGLQLSIYNWASAEGYQQDTAKPILICGQEADGKVYDMFPLQPGQKLTFVVIRGTSGRLRWAPF